MNRLDISIIIPTLNRTESLIRTIDKLMEFDYIPGQIIIIDQSKNIDEKLKHKLDEYSKITDIDYLRQSNPSSTTARNTGMSCAKYDTLIFMDDDVDVEYDTLYNVFEIFKNKNISMIAGIDSYQKNNTSKFGYIFGMKSRKYRFIGQVSESMFGRFPENIEDFSGRCETQWAMGFFFVVRKSLVDKWNIVWDESLTSYAYAEDLDFTFSYYKHAQQENKKCIIDSKIKVQHNCSREWRIASKKSTYMFVFNREYLSYKHFKGAYSRIRINWANIGVLIEKIIKKDNYYDFIKAMYYCNKYRKDIKNGNLHHELYE